MAAKKSSIEPSLASPISFHPPSNGEFCPLPPSARALRAERLFRELVEAKHKRHGLSRREFVNTARGMATALFVMNSLSGCGGGSRGSTGGAPDGGYGVTPDMMDDEAAARTLLSGDEFIVDVQVHASTPLMPWPSKSLPEHVLDFIHQIYVQSDTSVACITGVPEARSLGEGNVQARTLLSEIIEQLAGPRLLLHANADPELGASELDYISSVASHHSVAAFKLYPHRGVSRLDSEELGLPFLARVQASGVKALAAHRGISGGGDYHAAGSPADVVRAAKAFPQLNFMIYHAGWEPDDDEDHAFTPGAATRGVDRLIQALLDNGLGPQSNVYAELGTTWMNLMNKPSAAAHVLGKLLRYLGPERIVWGTDSVFNGVPQGQIAAFRAFSIPETLREAHGYPALDASARRQIFGLNASRLHGIDVARARYTIEADDVAGLKSAYLDDPRSLRAPDPREYEGPRSRREFALLARKERSG